MSGFHQVEMHMNKLQKIIIPSILVLGGCSAMPSAEKESREESGFKDNKYEQTDFFTADDKIEGERHKVVKQALTGYGDLSKLRQYATKKADDVCYKVERHKKMLAVSERTSLPPYIWENFPRIELTFVCVDDDRTQPKTSPVSVQSIPKDPVTVQSTHSDPVTVQSTPSDTELTISPTTYKKTSLFSDKYDRLYKIKDLLDRGVLTQEEFESEKRKILSGG